MSDIVFPLSITGRLPLCSGTSGFSALMALGALTNTIAHSASHDGVIHTDAEGLKAAKSAAYNAQDALIDSVAIIGRLVTYSDHKEVGELHGLGWLIVGLAELMREVQDASSILDAATPKVTSETKKD